MAVMGTVLTARRLRYNAAEMGTSAAIGAKAARSQLLTLWNGSFAAVNIEEWASALGKLRSLSTAPHYSGQSKS